MPRYNASQSSYYRREAAACAAAATSALMPDLRNAYLELELGWLSLTPKAERNEEPEVPPLTTRSEVEAEADRANQHPTVRADRPADL